MSKLILFTSNYARNGNHPDAVSISVTVPRWYPQLEHYPDLAPTWAIVKDYKDKRTNIKQYTTQYLDLLQSRNVSPLKVAEDLHGRIMLCYEKPTDFCHRHLVAFWLEHELPNQVIVKEILGEKDKGQLFSVIANCF